MIQLSTMGADYETFHSMFPDDLMQIVPFNRYQRQSLECFECYDAISNELTSQFYDF
jgi:hypothetical protein